MPAVHDRGGWPNAGPIDRTEHRHADWERQTDAVMRLLWSPAKRIIRVDEMRRAIESIKPEQYVSLGYYERWAVALETLVVEKGVMTKDEIDRKVAELERRGR